jgi:flagellar biosynthesis/type III secretory pathway M-ring protein FliF/YscJ
VIKGGDGAILDDGSLEDKQNALTEFVGASETIRIAKIPDHINIPLEQIKNLAIERPDTVAMLLKSWFLAEK